MGYFFRTVEILKEIFQTFRMTLEKWKKEKNNVPMLGFEPGPAGWQVSMHTTIPDCITYSFKHDVKIWKKYGLKKVASAASNSYML